VIQFLSNSDFIMVVNASRNVLMHSYAQVLNTRQTRPYFLGALVSAYNRVSSARLSSDTSSMLYSEYIQQLWYGYSTIQP